MPRPCRPLLTHLLALASAAVLSGPLAAAPLPADAPVHGWTIISGHEGDARAALAAAPRYAINHLELTHAIVGSLRDLRDPAKLALAQRLTDAAHAAGIAEVVLGDNSPYEPNYYPDRFHTGPGGALDLDSPAFWEWFKADYRGLLARAPQADGVVLTFIGSPGQFQKQHSLRLKTEGRKLAALVNAIADLVVGERHGNLYVRIFPNDFPDDPLLPDLIAGLARPEVRLMFKQSPLDYLFGSPNDRLPGRFDRPTVVEFDAAGEFNGQGILANTWPDDLLRRWRDFARRPHVIGYTARLDRLGRSTVVGRPGEINLLALKRGAEDPQVTGEQVYREFIDARYGAAARDDVGAAFKSAREIIFSSLYILGLVVNDHSHLDYERYTPPFGHLVSGRWLHPPITHVEHGVNREFHYFKDLVNHLAPAFVKDPRYVPPEPVAAEAAQWLQPGELLDAGWLRAIVTEKDHGVSLAEAALAHIEQAKPRLKPADYDDLHHYFARTLLTVRLHRAAAAAYFGFRVWARGAEFQTPVVRATVQRGLEEIQTVVPLIRAYPVPPPEAAYKWAEDADRAERYFRLIAVDGWPKLADQGLPNPQGGMKFLFQPQP